jgi:enediyne biosynthesis protein E4
MLAACNRKDRELFDVLPSSYTNVSFTNKTAANKFFNILYYLYYYNGGGVAAGDINNDGLQDLYFTANNKSGNKLYLNKGNFVFEDITLKAGVAGSADWCTGVTMADVNADGLLDIYVSTVSSKYGLKGHNELFINNGNLTFTEKSSAYGLNTSCFTTQSAFFDYDHDGDLDCYILNQSHHPHANIVDTNNRRKVDLLSGDRLYRNDVNVNGRFTDVSADAGIYQSNLGYGLGLAIADVNNDGWDDIYIGNDFHENDYYYINNGNGSFTESGAKHFRHYSRFSMGNDIADYNNDGEPDIITVDMLPPDEKTLKTYGSDENPDTYKVKLELRGYQHQYSKNCLQTNNGSGISFSENALQSGVAATDWSWCPLFADFDNDGNKDLLITSGIVKRPVDLDFIRFSSEQKGRGLDTTDKYDQETIDAMPDGSSHPFLFKGNGQLQFKDVSEQWGTAALKGYSNGAAYADMDNDGDLDIIVNCLNAPALVLRNNATGKNYISIAFKGDSINSSGIGCKAYLYAGGQMQYQQVMATRGFMSSSSTVLHFGLDSSSKIDSLLLVWPDQTYKIIKQPAINQQLNVYKKDAAGVFEYDRFFPKEQELLINVSDEVNNKWQHKENDFLDYNVQYLIPHALSTRGPKIAVADVNNDGLDDLYVCGAKFQSGALLIQQKDGTFQQRDTALFSRFSLSEEVDAVFFDANNDSFVDLFVVSGGNEVPVGGTALLDKLYLNNGNGSFTYAEGAMSVVYENKSCITVDDIDHDGDIDIFIGNLASPVKYGYPTTSYLYLNDGKGKFTKAGDNIIPLYQLGMVTAANFADIDNDGWNDLLVTGEWMPLKVFKNNKGKFTVTDVTASTGLWQSLFVTDVNGDGYNDVLAGNWGWNSKLHAGKNGPVKLYVKDFDNNGSVEQVMAYTIEGKEYPFLAKDELERQMPVLKKAYLKYSDVAGKTVDYIFYDLFKDYKELKAEVLASSCFINDGKGNFTRVDLPAQLQSAPIYTFAPVGKGSYIAVGNFYGTIPHEGRYDALQPSFFSFNKISGLFQYQSMLAGVKGEMRDVKWLRTAAGMEIVMAANNGPLLFFKPHKTQ